MEDADEILWWEAKIPQATHQCLVTMGEILANHSVAFICFHGHTILFVTLYKQ